MSYRGDNSMANNQGIDSDVKKSVMNPHHLEIGAIKDNKLYIDMNAWAFLRFKSNPLDKKGFNFPSLLNNCK